MIPRYAKRRDETERPIIDGLRHEGFNVLQLDFPDLLVRRPSDGRIFLLEVDGITRNRKRSTQQLKFLNTWQIPIVKNFDEAQAWIVAKY